MISREDLDGMFKPSGAENQEMGEVTKDDELKAPNYSASDALREYLIKKEADLAKADIVTGAATGEFSDVTKVNFDVSSTYVKPLLQKMKDENLIADYDESITLDDLTDADIVNLAEIALPIGVDEENDMIYYEIPDGETETKRVYIEANADESVMKAQISFLLPEPQFDTSGRGDIEKSKELCAIYKVLTVNNILNDVYAYRVITLLKSYDVHALQKNERNFSMLLKEITEDAPADVNIILAACNRKLGEQRIKKSMKLSQALTDRENQEQLQLNIKISTLRAKYDVLISREESRAQKEILREELDRLIREEVDKSPGSALYRIQKLSTKHIKPKIYSQIAEITYRYADMIRIKEGLHDKPALFANLKRQIKRRAFREYLAERRLIMYEDLRKGKESSLFI